ncbi:hypothetical protein [Agrobacterium tumefaciens]|uniref:hypothetical protein n=1 Tax=Agrobacterium tumefaciens TaxID=358 RepID=UPI001573EA8D|nr:hypothetical protein [Agrobacterium tumefaciens]NTB01106.1 hypothetical protein [Agrobacterium tumefaciens]
MLTKENIVPSDVLYALLDLSRVTATMRSVVSDMEFVRQDGSRIDELDTVSSLLRVTDDAINSLAQACGRFDTMNFDEPNFGISEPIRAALKDYVEKEAVYRPIAGSDECEAEWKAKEAAEDVLIRTPCVTLADVRAKARLAIKDENVFDSITNCRAEDGHLGIVFLKSILNEGAAR